MREMRHPGKVFNDLMLIILRFAKYGEDSCAAAATDDSRMAGGLSVCSFVAGFRMLQLVVCCMLHDGRMLHVAHVDERIQYRARALRLQRVQFADQR